MKKENILSKDYSIFVQTYTRLQLGAVGIRTISRKRKRRLIKQNNLLKRAKKKKRKMIGELKQILKIIIRMKIQALFRMITIEFRCPKRIKVQFMYSYPKMVVVLA